MKQLMRGLVAVAFGVVLTTPAWGGTSHIYLVGGQAEAGAVNPCSTEQGTRALDGMPYKGPGCAYGSNDTTYFTVTLPDDYNAAGVAPSMAVYQWPLDETTTGKRACYQASITVFEADAATNVMTSGLASVGGTAISAATAGQYVPIPAVTTGLVVTNSATGSACAASVCNGQLAKVLVKRVDCLTGGTQPTGKMVIQSINLSYPN
jgi:hypothetical protein